MTKEQFINNGFDILETAQIPEISNTEAFQAYIKKNNLDKPENLANLVNLVKILVEDEKVNGYGLNFVGRNFARAKYAQKTEKELRLNTSLSKDIDTTENLVLKGDNLDSLKILKNHYNGKIKCIYIDPPYNTAGDEFVYPDKFDKEEAEVLGLTNLSESDFARMDFTFKTKKSHNGWLAFMYPRLLLARVLLDKDGAIFISIDDNEQANLKLLCDDVFGEENFVECIVWQKTFAPKNDSKFFSSEHEYVLIYSKSKENFVLNLLQRGDKHNARYSNPDNDPRGVWISTDLLRMEHRDNSVYEIISPTGKKWIPTAGTSWRHPEKEMLELIANGEVIFGVDGNAKPRRKRFLKDVKQGIVAQTIWKYDEVGHTQEAKQCLNKVFDGIPTFDTPKPISLIQRCIMLISKDENDLILDFFAGSGTTGQAVMQLNAEDGGNRKFILCQIDEPIKEDKPAYKFCLENNLPPVISSITIERLKRAGERLTQEMNQKNDSNKKTPDMPDLFQQANLGNFENPAKIKVPTDVGFKVFDTVNAPKLDVQDGQIVFPEIIDDAISRIYNMIFTVGLDEPSQVPQEVVKDCIYKIGNHYYITNSEKITSNDYANAIKNGKVFIDGWTASLNGTLQNYKEDVKIVF